MLATNPTGVYQPWSMWKQYINICKVVLNHVEHALIKYAWILSPKPQFAGLWIARPIRYLWQQWALKGCELFVPWVCIKQTSYREADGRKTKEISVKQNGDIDKSWRFTLETENHTWRWFTFPDLKHPMVKQVPSLNQDIWISSSTITHEKSQINSSREQTIWWWRYGKADTNAASRAKFKKIAVCFWNIHNARQRSQQIQYLIRPNSAVHRNNSCFQSPNHLTHVLKDQASSTLWFCPHFIQGMAKTLRIMIDNLQICPRCSVSIWNNIPLQNCGIR